MVFRDVSTTRALALRMAHQAQHDVLTDLPNRLLLNDRITQAMALARRQKTKLAVLFLDLDRFKHINDSLGHDVGDRLLQAVARRLLGCVRGSDTVSRHGGDEFVVLLSQVRRARDAAVSAEKILVALGAPHRIGQHDLRLTASMGIATYPEDGADAETLMRHSDLALLHSKDAGGNSYRFFKAGMNARAIERQFLERGLRRAMARNEFVLHFQPQVNLKTGAIIAAEALAPSAARTRAACAVRAYRRRLRAHGGNWPLGPARSLPSGSSLAAGPEPASDPHRGEQFHGGASGQRIHCRRARCPHRVRPCAALSGARADRILPDAGLEVHGGAAAGPQTCGRTARAR